MLEEMLRRSDAKDDEPDSVHSAVRTTQFLNKKQWDEAYKGQTLKSWYCGFSVKMKMPSFIPRQIRNTPCVKVFDTYGLFCGSHARSCS